MDRINITQGSSEAAAVKVSGISIAVNASLTVLKLAAGILGRSGAMISDAVHSASDVFSTFVVIIGVKLAGKKADRDHPYGHERMECAAALILAMFLGIVGFGIGAEGIKKITAGNYGDMEAPGILPMAAAVISVAVKEWMFRYTAVTAKKINSGALMADAWHHRSDALSSVGAFAGILFSRLGFPVMDSIASVIISVFIVKAAYDIFKDGLDKMVDHSCDEETEKNILTAALSVGGVEGIDDLKTRLFGNRMYIDLEILVQGDLKLKDAHAIAEQVHDVIEKTFPDCKHCMVHVNPTKDDNSETD
ncbi:MAG: cation diffusion facilitator family transporter [Ruminococcus sp.]|nr:cation diffusion facilitator family transporter [Ruminococcus sp.]